MKVFLCGGGAAEQTRHVNEALRKSIDPAKPVLYIPLALEPELYDSCETWIHGELSPFGITDIYMVRSAQALCQLSFTDYSCVFIGGGNTFSLLSLLKSSGAFYLLAEYIKAGGIVMGGSAGAIIFSMDIHCADYADENIINLKDTKGLEILPGYDFACHFGNSDIERTQQEENWLRNYAATHNPIIALSEEAHLCVTDDKVTFIGPGKAFLFKADTITELSHGVLCL